MPEQSDIKLRPLEREDLRFVHQLDNNASVMRYWFEEPYEAFVELSDLYDKHIHDQSERRFVISYNGNNAGLVELVEINHIHRRAEFQIIISPEYQGKGLATRAAKLAMDYGFTVLNLFLDLLACLPEKQIRRDGRTKDCSDEQQTVFVKIEIRYERTMDCFGPVYVCQERGYDVAQEHQRKPFEIPCVFCVWREHLE